MPRTACATLGDTKNPEPKFATERAYYALVEMGQGTSTQLAKFMRCTTAEAAHYLNYLARRGCARRVGSIQREGLRSQTIYKATTMAPTYQRRHSTQEPEPHYETAVLDIVLSVAWPKRRRCSSSRPSPSA